MRRPSCGWGRVLGGPAAVLAFFYGFVGGRPLDNRREADNPVPLSRPPATT